MCFPGKGKMNSCRPVPVLFRRFWGEGAALLDFSPKLLGSVFDLSGRAVYIGHVHEAPGTLRHVAAARVVIELHGEAAQEVRNLAHQQRSEEHTSELQSLMRISYAVFCLK